MKNYHPKSWSQQARELCDTVVYKVNKGCWSIERAVEFFSFGSYRHWRVRRRAAKRFGRLVRNHKVHEHPETIMEWRASKEKYGGYIR